MEPGAAVTFEGLPASRSPAVTPSGADSRAGRPRSRWRKRWRTALIVLAVVVITVSAMTARLFIWPDQGMPARPG